MMSSVPDKREGWVNCLYPDCQKAFDTVLYGRLITNLDHQAGTRETPSKDRKLSKWEEPKSTRQRNLL